DDTDIRAEPQQESLSEGGRLHRSGCSLLASCQPGHGPDPGPTNGSSVAGTTTVTLPTFQEYGGPFTPDLRNGDPEIPVVFLAYPRQRFTSVEDKPLSGGTVTASLQATGAIPPSAPANSYWNELNERLGGELEAIISPAAEYLTKTQSLIAGGDIPDVVQLLPDVPNLPSLLEAQFSHLDDHLGGDGVLDYANLAAIPTYAWESCVFNGSLYGVPFAQPLLSHGLAVRDR